MSNVFLAAEWRKLAMINYAIEPALLLPYVPKGTVLDFWNGTCYVSLVGFMFQNTRLKGIKIPFHVNFEEVNLRFYVKCQSKNEEKRGVVFIKEIVPKPALTWVANTIYNENYETLPMTHSWQESEGFLQVSYAVKKKNWHKFELKTSEISKEISIGSEEEFITEHYWGYAKINNLRTNEYQVEHPRWKVFDTKSYEIDFDFGEIYGEKFSPLTHEIPKSVFLAEGSEIIVKSGRKL